MWMSTLMGGWCHWPWVTMTCQPHISLQPGKLENGELLMREWCLWPLGELMACRGPDGLAACTQTYCYWPWGSIRAGAHVSCATRQESSFSFAYKSGIPPVWSACDPISYLSPHHPLMYHISIIMDCLILSLSPYGTLRVSTASLY
jgi:hypothetical protein